MPMSSGARRNRASALAKVYKQFEILREDENDPETWPKYKGKDGNYIPLTTDQAQTDAELEERERKLKKFKPSGKYPWRER